MQLSASVVYRLKSKLYTRRLARAIKSKKSSEIKSLFSEKARYIDRT